MYLLIDVGNTNICFTTYDNEFGDVLRIETKQNYSLSELSQFINMHYQDIKFEEVLISSVVPSWTELLDRCFNQYFNIKPFFVDKDKETIKNPNKEEVGADIICDCISVKEGIIIDLGTATKIMYAKDSLLLGVAISPGIMTSFKNLSKDTALLPEIKIEAPNSLLGLNTKDALLAGCIVGHKAMIDEYIRLIKDEYDVNPQVYLTGGLSPLIYPLLKEEVNLDPNLTFKGLIEVYRRNK